MADVYELLVSVDLYDLTEAEAVELQWHLGLAPMPAARGVVPDHTEPVFTEDGRIDGETGPWPLLAGGGPARRIGGVLFSAMARDGARWALTSRQELHPDEFEDVGGLLAWLHARALDSVGFRCHLRFYEDCGFEEVDVVNGETVWP
ncbi:hypothetical protein ACWEPC_38670 [Nonomuraea sp. NPDC004297]